MFFFKFLLISLCVQNLNLIQLTQNPETSSSSKGLFDDDDDAGGLFGGGNKKADKPKQSGGGLFGDDPLFG